MDKPIVIDLYCEILLTIKKEVSVFPGGSKCLPMQETRIQFLGREDALEKDMATHSSILACKIPWTEEAGRLQSMRSQESDTT